MKSIFDLIEDVMMFVEVAMRFDYTLEVVHWADGTDKNSLVEQHVRKQSKPVEFGAVKLEAHMTACFAVNWAVAVDYTH